MPLNRQQRRAREHAERKALKTIRASAAQRDKPREFRIVAAGQPVAIQAADPSNSEKRLARFKGTAYTGAPMKLDGWWFPLIIDLDGVKAAAQNRPVLRQHDPQQIAGHTESVAISKSSIDVAGVFSGEQQHTDKITIPAANGFPWQMSVGGNPVRTEFLEAGETTTVNGREVTGPMTISRETEIGEISFVPLGADGDTSATVTASKGKPAMTATAIKAALKELMAELKAAGKSCSYTDAEIDDMDATAAKAALKKCMKAAQDDDDEDDSTTTEKAKSAARTQSLKAEAAKVIEQIRADAANEHARQAAIVAACKANGVTECELEIRGEKKKVNLAEHAIRDNWTRDQAELAAIRASRPGAGVGLTVYSTNTPPLSDAVLECAVLQAGRNQLFHKEFFEGQNGQDGQHRGRVPAQEARKITAELNARYPDAVQQAAHTHFKGRIGLQQVLTVCARLNGYHGSEVIRDNGDLASVAHHCTIRADGSTASLANVLANVQNKFMLTGYLWTEQTWKSICGMRSVNDFKPTKSINLFGDFQFKRVGPNGELDNATLADQAFANQVYTEGRMLTITRQNIINDDIGALTTVPMLIGRGAGLRLNDLFWTVFMNPGKDDGGSTNFYAATHTIANQSGNANYQSGAGSTLSDAGLTAAVLLFDNQVDPKGYPLGMDAEILLYPPDLEGLALRFMNSTNFIASALPTSANTMTASDNPWKGRFNPFKSKYLNKTGSYTGASTTAWYLLANPSILPVIEVAFLNGVDTPTVQTASPDFQFNTLGISMRAFFDPGVNAQNFRGGVLSAGA